jgi:type I restriction enzyme S subunit
MSWKIVKLGSVLEQRKGFITIDDSKEYKRCRVQVNRKGVVLRDVVKGSAINTKKQQLCKEGDFLVAEIDAKVGGYGFVGNELEGAIVSSHYFLFEVDESKMLKEYLAWLIKTDIIQEQINSKGSTNYAAIRPTNVLNFEIPLPATITEQSEVIKKLNQFHEKFCSVQTELEQQQSYL